MDKIEGWFTWPTLYKDMAERFPSGGSFVEVGVLKGQSLRYLIQKIGDKDIKVTGVDCFCGISAGLLEVFNKKMRGFEGKYKLIVGYSAEVAGQFKDNSLDFVFIDAAHDYDNIHRDIEAWFPKVKVGGVLAGHDYIPSYPGVMQAVNERFGDNVCRGYEHEGCWLINKKDG